MGGLFLHTPHHRSVAAVLALSFLLTPLSALAVVTSDASPGTVRDFVVTAYYSPLPGQCCYVMGSEQADKDMNGNGVQGADGTPVYPGMVAAPASYPFGTQIVLEGIGTVAVHDRGGAINVLDGDVHRIDLWVGFGEEGLARALAFGKRTIHGTILKDGGKDSQIDLEKLPADLTTLAPYDTRHQTIIGLQAKNGQIGLGIKRLQEKLQILGYFADEPTGKFGLKTAAALAAFNHDLKLNEPSDTLSDASAATIEALLWRSNTQLSFATIDRDSAAADIFAAKRVLRLLGFFRGRTTGDYDDALFAAILKFQQSASLVTDESSPGAGRIGPKTLPLVARAWHIALARQDAKDILLAKTVRDRLVARGELLTERLAEGAKGQQVKLLQKFLIQIGLLPGDSVTGTFGAMTKLAVAAFQQAKGLIDSTGESVAGLVGPKTVSVFQSEQLRAAIARVRGSGLAAL